MKHKILTYILGIILSIGIAGTAFAGNPQSQSRRILYLNSYQNGYAWSDGILNGIRSELSKTVDSLDLQVEFMDSKKYYGQKMLEVLHGYYKYKFRNDHFEVVITSDNSAFDFALKYRDSLFPGVPIVFCGLNNYNPAMLGGQKGITGIEESVDFSENLEIARRLHPNATKMVVIGNQTVTSLAIIREIKETIKEKAIDFKVSFISGFKTTDLQAGKNAFLENIPKDALLYIVPTHELTGKKFYTPEDISRMVCKAASQPVYSSWVFLTGTGIVGGKLASGFEQGKLAGSVAARILNGENPDDIPVVTGGGHTYIFDHNVLTRFRIEKERLPEASVIINEPYNFYKLNRQIFWVIISSVIILSAMVILLVLNMAQKRRANLAMRESKKKLQLILDNIPQLVFWQDKDLKLVDVNKSFMKFFNIADKRTIVGADINSIPRLGEAAKVSRELGERVLATNKPCYACRWKIRLNDQEHIWLEMSKIPLHDEDGNVIGVLSTAEDITKKINLKKQLTQAQKMEALGILSGGIAHDFNNILTSIINSTELAIDDVPPDSITRKDLERVLNAGNRGSNLVKQILTFSRPGHMQFRTMSMTEIVTDAMELLKTSLPGNLEIITDIGKIRSSCHGDPTQMHQVIMNLCTNSFQAMNGLGGRLQVGLRERTVFEAEAEDLNLPPGGYVELTVADNGPGIDPDILDKIFDPFFSTKSKNIGTGLGLSMVHGIVQGHNGAISVTSLPFEQTRFTILIPRIDKEDDDETLGEGNSRRGEGAVLFVEDNADQRESVPRTLEKLGYRVTPVSDAREAMERLTLEPEAFDLVITDYDMPRTSGLDLAKQIKEILPDLPVIMVSGRNVDFCIQESDNIRKFVVKPYNKTILSEAINEVMHGQDS
ncbi:MAG: response regulator [Desulfobacteraceae bacterium]|nr:response regulator [Desulfobacteraceae bacterium]